MALLGFDFNHAIYAIYVSKIFNQCIYTLKYIRTLSQGRKILFLSLDIYKATITKNTCINYVA
jgi:hypothetical protein